MDVMIPSNAPCVCNGCMVTRCASKIQPLASCPQCFSRKFLSRLLFSVRMTQKMPCWLAFQADGLTADSFRKSCLGPALVSVEVDVQCKARTSKWISSTQSGGVTIKIWQHIQSSLLFCWVWGMFFFFLNFFRSPIPRSWSLGGNGPGSPFNNGGRSRCGSDLSGSMPSWPPWQRPRMQSEASHPRWMEGWMEVAGR